MTFLDNAPVRADAADGGEAKPVPKPVPNPSFADEVGRLFGDPPTKPSELKPKPEDSRSTPKPSDPKGAASAAAPKDSGRFAPPPVDAKPFFQQPGLPSNGDIRLPSLSLDRMLGRKETPPLFFPKESIKPSTVIVPPRVPARPPVAGGVDKPPVDAAKTPSVVDTTKAPPVVDTTKAPPVVDTTKAPPVVDTTKAPPVVDTGKAPYSAVPKVDYLKQQREGPDATNTNPDKTPPKYPGPEKDQDKWLMKKLLKPSKLGSALYDLYLETSTDRSEENKVPDGIRIAELHKGMKEKVASVELLGDSEMFQPDQHGIVLHPTGRRHPGNFYAVLRDDNGIPLNVIQYAKGSGGKPQYLQQWIFDRDNNKESGNRTTTISYFRESQSTAVGRPGVENKTMVDAFMGRTEYIAGSGGAMLKATQYNNLNKPTVEIDYSSGTPTMQLRDSNSGQLRPSTYSRAFTTNMAFSGVYIK